MIQYRKLNRYKYQLMRSFSINTHIKTKENIILPLISFTKHGTLTIRKYYCWDGPSGPTFDTKTFMRGALVHDALYQLMREKQLDYKIYRAPADELLRKLCREDGMSKVRVWYVYHSVSKFGSGSAKPYPSLRNKVITI